MKTSVLWVVVLLIGNGMGSVWANPVGDEWWASQGDSIRELPLPSRSVDALGGTAFAHSIAGLGLQDREKAIVHEILSGNVPSFSRTLKRLVLRRQIGSEMAELHVFVSCDYLAVGSDDDYFYTPLTPSTAQYLADHLECLLPTKKLVDVIYARADVKLRPQPIPPSPQMTTVPVFLQHTDSIKQQFAELGLQRTPTALVAGHKKDIIISKKIYTPDRDYDRVVIYGWHTSVNHPIQPVYNGHHANYADYSHGVRLIWAFAVLNGDTVRVVDLLRDLKYNVLVSDEGIIPKPTYPPSPFLSAVPRGSRFQPGSLALWPVFPNPFHASATIQYRLPKRTRVHLLLYNALGQRVLTLVDDVEGPGDYQFALNSQNLPAGAYWLQLQADGSRQTQKILLLR